MNIQKSDIYKKILIPEIDLLRPGNKINTIQKQIVDKEFAFLSSSEKAYKNDKILDLVEKHNKTIEQLASDIDLLLFEAFSLSSSEQQFIINYIKSKNLRFCCDTYNSERDEEPKLEVN